MMWRVVRRSFHGECIVTQSNPSKTGRLTFVPSIKVTRPTLDFSSMSSIIPNSVSSKQAGQDARTCHFDCLIRRENSQHMQSKYMDRFVLGSWPKKGPPIGFTRADQYFFLRLHQYQCLLKNLRRMHFRNSTQSRVIIWSYRLNQSA